MLGVGYNYHRLRSSELECYVDGQLVLTADVSMPTSDDVSLLRKTCTFVIKTGGMKGRQLQSKQFGQQNMSNTFIESRSV